MQPASPVPTRASARATYPAGQPSGVAGHLGRVEQTEQCLKNIEAALTEAGAGFADVVRVTYVLVDAAEFGLDPAEGESVWNDPEWKLHLKEANDAAIARGVFGAPFFMIDGEPFWGNDRRAQIERWLESGPF